LKTISKKIEVFRLEFILFWVSLFSGALISVVSFIYFSFMWAFISSVLLAILVSGAFAMGRLLLLSHKQKQYEEKKIEKFTENAHDAVIMYDQNFRIFVWNQAAEEIFKLKKEDIIGQTISPEKISIPSFKYLVQTIFPSLAPSINKKSAPGAYPQLIDISFIDSSLELSVVTDKILDEDNNIIGFIKLIKNKTREINLIRSKSEFITVAAHQLRTPLTAVHWIFEIFVKNNYLSSSDKELASNGLSASVKLLKIVNDLLDISKIESGKFGYVFTKIDLNSFMDSLLQNANILAKKYSVFLYFERPKSPIIIHGDSQKLGIAFSNLLDNAIKYNVKNGQVVVKIEPYPNRPYIQVSIKDTGFGMSKDVLGKLFSKFFRGDNIIKEQTEGSGLGLYITKNIVLRHGGNISAESVVGRGSTFYVVLPTDSALIPPKEVAMEG